MQQQVDYLIIGAGPGGLQLGYFLEKSGRSYLILEAGESAGTFYKTFPRHRKLISINKVYTGHEDRELNLRWDWNSLLSDSDEALFKNYTKRYFPHSDDMVRYLSDFAAHFNLNVRYGTRVAQISRDGHFVVTDTSGNQYSGQRLIMGTGLSKPYVPPIPGAELAERYVDVTVDPEQFVNQRVLIIGKGNSAFETADNLVETTALLHLASPSKLKLAWKSHYPGHLRAVNNNLLDTYLLKSQNGLLDATVEQITKQDDGTFAVDFGYTRAHGAQTRIVYDRVILCTGFRFDASLFDESCRPALTINDRFPDQTSEWESRNISDLYFVGSVTQMRDFKKTQSAFIHGFRYNSRALFRMMEVKYHGAEWPSETIGLTADDVCAAVVERMNRSSGLLQQTSFLCDLVVVSEQEGVARYYQELPVDYLRDSAFSKQDDYYTLALEYGPDYPDYPFEFNRFIKPDESHLNPQLHPVIRHFRGGECVAEHHVMEDLEATWQSEEYVAPLRAFFREQMPADTLAEPV